MTARLLALLVVCMACRSKHHPAGTCLALDGAARHALVADPDGHGLYWLEDEVARDFDGDISRYTRLVHHDIDTNRTDVISDYIAKPLVVVGDHVLAIRPLTNSRVAIFERDGRTQDLTPANLDVHDFEPIDDHRIAFLASGAGPNAIYVLDLNEPRPTYLCDADTLLDASGGKVFAIANDAGISIDLQTGARGTFKPSDQRVPLGTWQLEVDHDRVVIDVQTRPISYDYDGETLTTHD